MGSTHLHGFGLGIVGASQLRQHHLAAETPGMGWSNWGGCCAQEALWTLHLLISWQHFCLQNLIWAATLCVGAGGEQELPWAAGSWKEPSLWTSPSWMLLVHPLADGSHPKEEATEVKQSH